MQDYVTIACKLYTFSMLYDTLVSNGMCENDYDTLVGKQKMWTEFLCNDRGRPMHKMYKWLGTLGLMLLPCKCLYLSDKSRKGFEVDSLTNDQVVKEFYNVKLRISGEQARNCITTLPRNCKRWMIKAHDLLSSAIRIRKQFLTFKYCQDVADPDEQHAVFQTKLQSIDKALVDRINQLRLTKIPLRVNYTD